MIRVVHPGSRIPDPDADFLLIPDPGVKKAPDPGSATLLTTAWICPTPLGTVPVLEPFVLKFIYFISCNKIKREKFVHEISTC